MLQVAQREELETLSRSAIAFAGTRASAMKLRLDGVDIEIKPGDDKESQTRPFGFDVHRAKREFLEEKTFMQYLQSVATDGSNALAWCKEREVPVLAILPETVWVGICTKAELFTLWPNQEGKVLASCSEESEFVQQEKRKVREKTLFGFGWRKNYDVMERDRNVAAKKATEHYFYKRNKKALMLGLFPNYTNPESTYNANWVDVRFPTPDADFGKALLILQKHRAKIGITVEADAIDVSQYAKESVEVYEREIRKQNEAISRRRKEELQALFAPQPDPILTFPSGKVRVIVAQYGNWPLELVAIKNALEQDLRMKD